MPITHEQAINKLDQMVAKIKNQKKELTEKDNSLSQLEESKNILSGSYKKLIDHLAEARKLVSHLQKDLTAEKQDKEHIKQELAKTSTLLEEIQEKGIKERDREIQDLKTKIKELTEVKMAREQSEERLRKQSDEFLQVQKIHEQVYNILGKYSEKTGLLSRSQEVANKIRIWETLCDDSFTSNKSYELNKTINDIIGVSVNNDNWTKHKRFKKNY